MSTDHNHDLILIEDNRVFRKRDYDLNCPICGFPLIYSSESYKPHGDLFGCCRCKIGWMEISIKDWKKVYMKSNRNFPWWCWGDIETAGKWLRRKIK